MKIMTQQENSEAKVCKQIDKKSSDDKKQEKDVSLLKVVIRRLPPSLTPVTFLEQVSPLPDYDFFYFVKADMSLGGNAFTRAYINFTNQEDVFTFRDKFDNYIFVDAKGNEYPAIVEFSPFQKVPKRKAKKLDSKKGTIKEDSDYLKFLELLENPEVEPIKTIDTYLEEIEAKEKDLKANHGCPRVTTPLIEFIKKRKEEKKAAIQRIREERKRKEQERRRQKEDERRKRREKERERQREDKQKFPEGKDKGKDKNREKDKDKEQKESGHKDDLQPVKLLRNPDREKDPEKESVIKSDTNVEKPKEKLRFAKENRPGGRGFERASTPDKSRQSSGKGNDRPPDKFRGGRDERPGSSFKDKKTPERSKFGRDWDRDRDRDRDRFRNRDRDRERERERFREREKERDKDRETERDKWKDRNRENDRDREKLKDLERDKNRDRDMQREEKFLPSGRDDRRRSEPVPDSRERGLSTPAKKDPGIKAKVDNNETWDKSKHVKSVQSKDSISSNQSVEGGAKSKTSAESKTDSEEEKARRKRKERPERAIYVPRKALERMQQESKAQTDTKRDKPENSTSKNKDGKGDG